MNILTLAKRPIVNYYSTIFILWELSTPFLNIHWFMDKLGRTGSKLQLYNGLLLLFSFFTARLVFGTYQSACVLYDLWLASNHRVLDPVLRAKGSLAFVADDTLVPRWLMVSYLLSNLTLNYLNFSWFGKMIKALRKRFEPEHELITEAEVDVASLSTGTQKLATPRRRKA